MPLNIVVGANGAGKSKYIYSDALKCEKESKNAVVFVPSQSRMVAEEEYIQLTKEKGMLFVEISTLSRFIKKELEKDGSFLSSKYLSEDAKRIAIKKIMAENKERFRIFAKVKDKPSFVSNIISYIDVFRKENIDIDTLQNIDISNNITKGKLLELADICSAIIKEINEKYIDSIDEMDLFKKGLSENKILFNHKKVFFHGYNNFSKKELEIIKEIVMQGTDVTISLTIPVNMILDEECDKGIFDTPYNTYTQIVQVGKELGQKVHVIKLEKNVSHAKEDIKYLADNIFNSECETFKGDVANIKLKLEKNMNTEIENIARDILYKVRNNKELRYRDFAVYTNNFEMYGLCIKRIFSEYDISYHFDSKYEINSSKLVSYLLNLFKLITDGIKVNELMIFLKTGLTCIQIDDVNYLENYIMEFGVKGYLLVKEFKKNNKEEMIGSTIYDLEKLNEIREKILEYINSVKDAFSECDTSKGIIEVVYNHLIKDDVILRYEKQVSDILEENIQIGELRKQVVQKIYEAFDNIYNIIDDKISLKGFAEMFEFAIDEIEVSTIPIFIDQVEICDVNKTRTLNKKFCYFIGAYEGGFPAYSGEDAIFSDDEIEALKEFGLELKQGSLSRINMALFNIYIALCRCEEELSISVPSSKITGEALRPSSLIQSIKQVVKVKIDSNVTVADGKELSNQSEIYKTDKVIFRNMLEAMVQEQHLTEEQKIYVYSVYKYFESMEKQNDGATYNDILNYVRRDENLSENTLNKLYKDKIDSSVSRLETFKRCPFSYFSNYILNLKPRKMYDMSVMDIGSLMHEVLDRFSKWTMERSISWHEIITDEEIGIKAKQILDQIIEDIFDKHYYKYKESNRHLVLKEKLKLSMYKIVQNISRSFNQSEFKPLGYEIEFKNNELYAPIEIELTSGNKKKTMYLVGKIDRVDIATIENNIYIRIVDYKSSSKSLKLQDIKEGISLQLMTYMNALIVNKDKISKEKPVIPAALNYFTLKANIKKMDSFESDENKINKKIIEDLKLKGIYLNDIKVLEGLDKKYLNSTESYLDINKRNISNEDKALTKENFEKECKNVQHLLKQIGEEIITGNVSINPKKVNNRLPCEYCDYSSICRKNCRA